MTIELFKKRVRQGSPALPMDSILDYLLGHYHGLGTVYSPANIVSYLSASDASSIVNALNCLCGEPYSLLERHWTFFDQQTGNTFEIIDTEIDSALSTQEFFHPVNGVLVPNFWNYIGLSYTSTEEFERLFSEQKKKTDTIDRLPEAVTAPNAALMRYIIDERPTLRSLSRLLTNELIKLAIPRLQQNANHHRTSSEDALTDALIAPLVRFNTLQRDSNCNGHVDFFYRCPIVGSMIIVGEAKLHCSKGISWYEEGLLKLTDKYSQSDSSIQFAMLVYYFRERNFFDVLADWRTQVEQRKLAYFLSFQSMSDLGLEDNSQAFVTVHNSHGRNLSIVHLWVRLFSDTDVAVKKHSRGKAKKDTAVAVKKPSRRKAKK